MKKRFGMLGLILVLCWSLFAGCAWAANMPWAGAGTEQNPYILQSPQDMQSLAALVNAEENGNSFAGKYFRLTADITLPEQWVPIGVRDCRFGGSIDGAGHLLTVPEGGLPLLGYVRETTVKNLNIYGPKIAGDGLIDNYSVDHGEDGDYWTGCPWAAKIDNCIIKAGTQTLESGFIGGYASGHNDIYISNCRVEAGVVIGYDKQQSCIGSIAGQFSGQVYNCVSYATVYGVDKVGGIVGAKGQSMGVCRIQECVFGGQVEASGEYTGGILGSGYVHKTAPNSPCSSILSCYVNGNVTGGNYVGGIFGGEGGVMECWDNGIGYVQNNCFYGKVAATAEEGVAGGVIGVMASLDCYNEISGNYYWSGCGVKNGIGQVDHVRKEGVFARSDDPTGADKNALCRSVNGSEFKNGMLVQRLNQDLNSCGVWQQGPKGPELGDKKHLLRLVGFGGLEVEGDGSDMLAGKKLTLYYSDGSTATVLAKYAEYENVATPENIGKTLPVKLLYANHSLTFSVKVEEPKAKAEEPKEEPKAEPKGTVTVKFILLGDELHKDSAAAHTLKDGNLQVWLAQQEVTVPEKSTVLAVLVQALQAADFEWSNAGEANGVSGNYIESITRPAKTGGAEGVTLAEFDNGPRSGWMYALNDAYPDKGVSEQVVQDGDVIIFHYTDDYAMERNTEFLQ